MNKTTNLFEYIENNTLRLEASHRGGGIEIDASEYLELPGAKLTAYQNYLGGGMTGAVLSDRNFSITSSKRRETKTVKLQEALKRYFYNITNDIVEEWDEWAVSTDFEQQQTRPGSTF